MENHRAIRREIKDALASAAGRASLKGFSDSLEPDVSVVVPVEGDWTSVRRTLVTLQPACATADIEVLLIDDGASAAAPPWAFSVPGLRVVTEFDGAGRMAQMTAGARCARGHYLAFLRAGMLVLPTWLDRLLETMVDDRIGVACGRVVSPTGRLISAGGIVWGDGSYQPVGAGCDMLDSAYTFRRQVDYCSTDALLLRSTVFRSACLSDGQLVDGPDADPDLGLTIAARGHVVLFEPVATAVGRARAGPSGRRRPGPPFLERWAPVLSSRRLPSDDFIVDNLMGSSVAIAPRVLVCDVMVPTPDRHAGGSRMDWVLRLLKPMTSHLTVFPMTRGVFQGYAEPLRAAGVEVCFARSFARFLRSRPGLYDIVVLSRLDVAKAWVGVVRAVLPDAVIIFDTVDLESVRRERQERLTGRSGTSPVARAVESRIVEVADLTSAVTPHEAAVLHQRCPTARVHVLPTVHERRADVPPGRDGRSGLLFIGSFLHAPNVDAVQWFADAVLPRILEQLEVELVVVGPNLPPSLPALCPPEVRFMGWVPDVQPVFDAARVFVAPLRYGAGMKGKVGQALALGTPVVTTTCGAEGMDLEDGVHVLIRDSAGDFAEAVGDLYRDPALWQRLATNGREVAEERWGLGAMRRRLEALLADVATLQKSRERDGMS